MNLETDLGLRAFVAANAIFVVAGLFLILYERRTGLRIDRLRANLALCVAVFSLTCWWLSDFGTEGLALIPLFVAGFALELSVVSRVADRLEKNEADADSQATRRG